MQTTASNETWRDKIAAAKTKVMLTIGTGMLFLVSNVSAGALDTAISPILTDVTLLFTPILALILAVLPILITLAIVGFVLGLLARVLGYI